MKVKDLFLDAAKSRLFWLFWGILLVEFVVLVVIVIAAAPGVAGNLTTKVHWDVVSAVPNSLSQDASWTYIFNFAAFGMIVFLSDIAISLKLLGAKNRSFALGWLSLNTMIFLVIIVLAAKFLGSNGL